MVTRLLLFFFVGATLGNVVASWAAPQYLAWDFTPRSGQAICPCTDTVISATSSLVRYQLIGSLSGGVLLLVLGAFFLMTRKKRVEPTSPPPTQA